MVDPSLLTETQETSCLLERALLKMELYPQASVNLCMRAVLHDQIDIVRVQQLRKVLKAYSKGISLQSGT